MLITKLLLLLLLALAVLVVPTTHPTYLGRAPPTEAESGLPDPGTAQGTVVHRQGRTVAPLSCSVAAIDDTKFSKYRTAVQLYYRTVHPYLYTRTPVPGCYPTVQQSDYTAVVSSCSTGI